MHSEHWAVYAFSIAVDGAGYYIWYRDGCWEVYPVVDNKYEDCYN